MPTGKIIITNDTGEQVEATAPVIVSASRSTDIPAFYAKWFFNRLAKGYCAWYNPFNQQKMRIRGGIRRTDRRPVRVSQDHGAGNRENVLSGYSVPAPVEGT